MNDAYLEWLKLEQCVPQGTALGPLLLKLYVSDSTETLDNSCTLVQYFDDTTLLIFIKNPISSTQIFDSSFNRILS